MNLLCNHYTISLIIGGVWHYNEHIWEIKIRTESRVHGALPFRASEEDRAQGGAKRPEQLCLPLFVCLLVPARGTPTNRGNTPYCPRACSLAPAMDNRVRTNRTPASGRLVQVGTGPRWKRRGERGTGMRIIKP